MPVMPRARGGVGQYFQRLLLAGAIALGPLAVGAEETGRPSPLALEQTKDLYQRILTLPGAVLQSSPGESAKGEQLPVFSIYYVFQRRDGWVQVGGDLRRGPEGWLASSQTQDWSIMLTMQYAPPGQRERVTFFERRQDLRDLVAAVDPAPLVRRLVVDADAGRPTDPRLAAVEPPESRGTQQREGKFYLIPIVGFDKTRFDDGQQATLLRVSFINEDQPPPTPPPVDTSGLKQFRAGIVFVLDTTVSMKPFFERAAQSIQTVINNLKVAGLDRKVSVGVVAYRSYTGEEPWKSGLGYTVKVIQPLDPDASLDQIRTALRDLDEARISSFAFDEDAFAGLWTPLTKFDWSPFGEGPKMIWLITDAGAIRGNNPRAMFPGIDLENIVETANRKGIMIFPLHIASAGAKRSADIARARAQWTRVGATGEPNAHNYQTVDPGTPEQFDQFMTVFEQSWKPTFEQWRKGLEEQKPEFLPQDSLSEHYRKLVVNGLFSAQQRYLGIVNQTETKPVFDAWTTDHDLTNHNRIALQVAVFLTRTQLNQLAMAARRFVDIGKSQQVTSATMFRLLQTLSAQTQNDPERFKGDAQKVGDMGLMPDFLRLLPYKSDILALTERDWAQKTAADQEDILTHIEAKIRAYRDIYADKDKWQDFGGQDVMPVPLDYLP